MNFDVDAGEQSKAAMPDAHKWINRLHAAHSREKTWRKLAYELMQLYECEVPEASRPYNIMFATTDTLAPALYNNVPRPVVKPRFVQRNAELARVAAITAQRVLSFSLDYSDSNSSDFDECMRSATLASLVAGRGQIRIRYEANLESGAKSGVETTATENEEAPGETAEPVAISGENVVYEQVPWDQFLHGYAASWDKVPWVAFCHLMSSSQFIKAFGKGAWGKLRRQYKTGGEENCLRFSGKGVEETTNRDALGTAPSNVHNDDTEVWEIWDKTSKKVLFVCPDLKDSFLKTEDDPLNLKGFFPCPRPMMLYRRVKGLTPQALYEVYSSQARELNNLTVRIKNIIAACRVRGFYNSAIENMEQLFAADDNTMLPITNAMQLGAQGISIDQAIWIMPLEQLTASLEKLYLQRQQIKTIIFELTGIADIMRGSSQASETLGAQQLKNQWGSLRLKRLQFEANRFARDAMRLHLEVAVNFLSPELLREMTNMPLPTVQEQESAQQAVMGMQQQMMQAQQMAAMQAQQTGQPPQPDPQMQAMQQEMQQAQAILSVPSIDSILEMLQDDAQRTFNITVDTNSMVDADATDDKQDMADMLNALGQFVSGTTPMMQSGIMTVDTLKTILLHLLRRFRMGMEVEEAVMQMSDQGQGNSEQAQQELQKAQEELAQKQQELDQAGLEFEAQKKQFQQEQQFAARQAEADKQMALREIQMNARMSQQEISMEKAMAKKELDMELTLQKKDLERMVQEAIGKIDQQKAAFDASVNAQNRLDTQKAALEKKEKSDADVQD